MLLPSLQATKTLLVTDMVVKVEDEVPEIVCEDPRPLLFHARDNALERVEDSPEVRLKGWRRIVQVGGYLALTPAVLLPLMDVWGSGLRQFPRDHVFNSALLQV